MVIVIPKNLQFISVAKAECFIGIDKSSVRRVIAQRGLDVDDYELVQDKQSGVPHNALCYFKDGDKICCVFGDFINLQESPAGFGDTNEEALTDLSANWKKYKQEKGL